jgi:DNA-binding MarR family transcriptional regulator
MKYDHLKLANQVCFPVYTASRLITREYQPYLSKMKITYPQYLVLLVLWETDNITVNDILHKLYLNTNTITPLLKRMESQGILERKRSVDDERKVIISLTAGGKKMKKTATTIPNILVKSLKSEDLTISDLTELREKLNILIKILSTRDNKA